MINKQIMQTIEKEFIVDGTGRSKEETYGEIFSKLRKEAYKEIKGVVLHMEPLNVYLLEEEEKNFTEKFLGLLMPKMKQEFYIKLKITVLLKIIYT
ncbi:MAG: DUF4312 family protein [Eubacteriales bacterium]